MMTMSNTTRPACLLAAAILLPLHTATAGNTPELPAEIALPALLGLVADHSPELAADRAELDVAKARRVRAAVFPRPEFEFGEERRLRGENVVDGVTREFMIEQELPVFGQRTAAMRDADLEIEETEALFRIVTADAMAEARMKFFELLAHQRRLAVLGELQRDLRRSRDIVAEQVEEALKSRYDLLRIDLEIAETDNLIHTTEGKREKISAKLAAIVGEPHWRPRARGQLRPLGIATDEAQLWASAKSTLPALVASHHAAAAALERIDLTRLDARPTPTVDVGLMTTSDPSSRSGLYSVEIDLPIFDTPRKAIDIARAESRAADLSHAARTRAARADLTRGIRLLHARRAALDHYEEAIIRQLAELRTMSEQAYAEGEMGIVDLMDAFQTLLATRLSHIDLIEEVMSTEVAVLAAAGRIHAMN